MLSFLSSSQSYNAPVTKTGAESELQKQLSGRMQEV